MFLKEVLCLKIKCSECGFEIENDALKNCPKCGCPMVIITCPECNEQVSADDVICKNCGYPLKTKGTNAFGKFKFNSKLIVIIVCIISLLLIGTSYFCVLKNNFNDKLVSTLSWTETKYGYNISFSEDGILKYHKIDWIGHEYGLNYSVGVAEYKVLSSNKIKIGDQKVKIEIKNDGTLCFEPDFKMILNNLKENEKENR